MGLASRVVIIGTGGTIAGRGSSAADLTGYTAGSFKIEDLINEVPTLDEYGPFEVEQFSNIESSDITLNQWMQLAARVNYWTSKPDVAGVVITHGTDSMEETAYFLQLTVNTVKPVVITGSMRPATGISAEGPLNLLNAVQTVRSSAATGKGVMVLLNGYIDNARDVRKMNTTNVATFGNPILGHMGLVQDGQAFFYNESTRKHTVSSEFIHLVDDNVLPKQVEILYLYAGMSGDIVRSVLMLPIDGLVVAGLGHGTVPTHIRDIFKVSRIPIVRASRTGSGMVSTVPSDSDARYLVSDTLSPEKARILLMLALMKSTDLPVLAKYFQEY